MKSNFSQKEYIPTMCFLLIEKLFNNFPNHHLIISDFYKLSDTIGGIDSPVVQTRFENTMVPVSTYMVF
jgi:hypothetical protein